jgi:hypothetical protein
MVEVVMELIYQQKAYSVPELLTEKGLTNSLKAKSIEVSTEIIKDGKTLQGISRFKAVELDTPVQMIENLLTSSLAFYSRIEEGQLAVKILSAVLKR